MTGINALDNQAVLMFMILLCFLRDILKHLMMRIIILTFHHIFVHKKLLFLEILMKFINFIMGMNLLENYCSMTSKGILVGGGHTTKNSEIEIKHNYYLDI